MSGSLQIYYKLPPWARSVAASLRGYYLNNWRYSAQTETLVEEALERDYWSEKTWKDWREERLSFLLHRAATKVPFYREQWAERKRNGDKSSWQYLENWTILEKQTLRKNAVGFIAEDCNPSKMYQDHTSGTTGSSLNLWVNLEAVRFWYALFEARSRRWYGVSRKSRWAMLGGQLVTPVHQQKPPFWVWNAGSNQLYMSSYHLAPDLICYYLDALKKYHVEYILGYSSAVYSLAQLALRENRKDLKMRVVITNAEPLFEYQRKTISKAFDCPVRETYGMAEIAAAAGECSHGKLHQWLDVGVIEGEENSQNSLPADFICTGLINTGMPLIRYRVGDCGTFSDEKCECGRTLPLLGEIEGRSDDVLYTTNGRRMRLASVFKDDLHVIEAQIIQNSIKELVVKLIPDKDFNQNSAQKLTDRIKERIGDIEIRLETVSHIPRTKRGKFRAVLCNLSEQEKSELRRSFNESGKDK